ncbi:MAG: hypothetical protein F6K19_49135, partial [Cyanothece sp. SIO1E1]|nr:hypothetical protein [Cyanothece sp. SIO1E1]
MKPYSFSLQPWPSVKSLPEFWANLKITGGITRHHHTLTIDYALLGPLSSLVIPTPATMPVRQHQLWEDTKESDKPIGVATYRIVSKLPQELKGE